MYSFYLNIVLVVIAFLLLAGYLAIKIYFTRMYQQSRTLQINSNNNVISNREISEIAEKMKNFYGLSDWTINYGKIKYSNFGMGINRNKKVTNIARLPFTSSGYEIDYVLSRIWYVKATREKQSGVKLYSFLSNYLMKILPVLGILLFLLQLAISATGFVFTNGEEVNIPNDGMQFLFQYPIAFIFLVISLCSMGVVALCLEPIKEHIELVYTGDTYPYFSREFSNFAFDLKSARTYSQSIKVAYNFSFKQRNEQRLIHWIGPMVNY